MRAVPEMAVDFVKQEEEGVFHVYDDADKTKRELAPGDVVRGRATAGWGHTGPDVVAGNVISPDTASVWLFRDLCTASDRLAHVLTDATIACLTDHQWSALLSFVFNLGADPKWTIWKRLNARQFDQVPLEMMKFVNATIDGKEVKVQGLVNRRAAEVAFWATEEPGTSPDTPPSSVTRAAVTAPTPQDPTPPSRSKAVLAAAAATVAGVPSAAKQVSDAISPYAEHSHVVGNMVAILATLAALAAGAAVIFAWLHTRKVAG